MDFLHFGAGVDKEDGGVVPNTGVPFAVVGGEALIVFIVGDEPFIFIVEC